MSLISLLLNAIGSSLEAGGDLLGDLGAPFLHRLEAIARPAVLLGLAVEFVLGLVEVDLEAQRLRHIPWCVAEHLDLIALGILGIDRPGVAVAGRPDALA